MIQSRIYYMAVLESAIEQGLRGPRFEGTAPQKWKPF